MSGVQSIERAFSVLRRLSSGPAGVTELAERVDLPKSTVSRILSTLEAIGAVEQTVPGGPYRIGDLMVEIVSAVRPGRGLLDLARPHLADLTALTGEATGISVIDGNDVLYLDQVDSPNAVQVRDWSGERIPLHVVSSGLVLLAYAPAEAQRAYLSRQLEAFTAKTLVEPDAVRRRLTDVRKHGYAWVFEEFSEGINSVAAPLHDQRGRVSAALHVHGPAYRFPAAGQQDAIAAQLLAAAHRIDAAGAT